MSIPYRNDRLLNPSRSTISIDKWYGLNYTDTVANGECTEMKNISSDGTYLMPRPPREVIASGITNPQRVLFCGDRLSYIAEGRLKVQNGDTFEEVGEVGNVTSAVDFNNQKMLFYPTDIVYDYENKTVSKVESYLTKMAYGDNTTGNSGTIIENGDYSGYGILLKSDNDTEIISVNTVKNADGKEEYAGITINVITDDYSWINADGKDSYLNNCKLFVTPLDANNNQIGSIKYRGPYNFGTEIRPEIPEVGYAAAYKVYVVYYNYGDYSYGNINSAHRDELMAKRDRDADENSVTKFWLTGTEYPAANTRPNIAYACMDNNRVVAVQGNNFYASCLGDYTNWSDFTDAEGNPKETGAYAEELYTYGDFTGIIKYRNNVIITKKNMLYECYGNKPPYRINLAANVGCVDNRSMVEVGGVLYWLGADGVYRYSGGLPVNISNKINPSFGKFTSGCAATDGRRYYIYAVGEEKSHLLVYDTFTGLWYREDDIEIADLTSFDNWVYALTTDGTLYKFNSGNETVEWEYQTKDFDLGTSLKKIPKKLVLKTQAALNAKFDIYIKYDNDDYKRLASYTSFEKSVVEIKLKNKVCNSFSLKLCGSGDIRLQGMSIEVIGSGKKHNDKYLMRY